MVEIRNQFPKSEHLSGKKNIDQLFSKGEVIVCYPYRIIYSIDSVGYHAPEVLVSVPKRSFKRAVQRNWIKRRVKECYRLRKSCLMDSNVQEKIQIAFLYIGKEMHDYDFLDKKMEKALNKINAIRNENR